MSGFYFDHPEIVPDGVQGDFRFNRNDEAASRFASNETEVRAVVEGQMMAKRIHAERMGFVINPDTRILVTGGASVNTVILQIIADVFNAKVYNLVSDCCFSPSLQFYHFPLQPDANSAALGGAYRARHVTLSDSTFDQLVAPVAETAQLVCSPNKDAVSVKLTSSTYISDLL